MAQDYRFTVRRLELQAHVQPNAALRLEYEIEFQNAPAGRTIDIVDIGLPHRDYSISNMTAAVDGQQVAPIRKSEYVDIGVEIHLGARSIRPGQSGVLTFRCMMPEMVYSDTTDPSLAALQIRPTWFDPKFQQGPTHLKIAVHLPPEVAAEQVKWHSDQTKYDTLVLFGEGDENHVVAVWDYPNHRLSSSNPKIGISFPRSSMERVVEITAWGLFVKWFTESAEAQVASGMLLLLAFAVLFYRFSGLTGWTIFVIVAIVSGIVMYIAPVWHLIGWPVLGMMFALNEWRRTRREGKYLPAMATVEGGGIKRGLTAPQAAVLLEAPLGRVLALVIFGLLKKGVLELAAPDPLQVKVREPFQKPRIERRKEAQKLGVAIHSYEQPFIDLLLPGDKPVEKINFSKAVGELIKSTAARMKGFDLSDTQDYYRAIVARAWRHAESLGEINQRDEAVERNFDWMMMDPTFDDHWDTWAGRGYYYRPIWGGHHSGGNLFDFGRGGQAPASQTSLGEVAGSFAGWTENMTGRLASSIEPGSLGLGQAQSVVDLGVVDRITGDVFEALTEASQSSGGGGGGGGCACACAGCACACACAGGGR